MRTWKQRLAIAALVVLAWMPAQAEDPLAFELISESGWNILAVPIGLSEADAQALIGEEAVWEWAEGRFKMATTVEAGKAYYFQNTGARSTIVVNGDAVKKTARQLTKGWNLIGGIGYPPYADLPLPLRTEPKRALSSVVYGYDGNDFVRMRTLPAGTGAWVYAFEPCTVSLCPNPSFDGIELAYSHDAGSLTARWNAATDDRDKSLIYHVYGAAQGARSELIDPDYLIESLDGQLEIQHDGFTAEVAHDLVVVAEDSDGNKSWFPRIVQATPIASSITLPAGSDLPIDLGAAGIEVGDASDGGASLTLTGDTGALTPGDVIVVDDERIIGLRRILSVAPSRSSTTVTTEEVSLGQVIDSGTLRSCIVLSEPLDFGIIPPDNTASRAQSLPLGSFFLDKKIGKYGTGKVLFDNVAVAFDMDFDPSFDVEAVFDEGLLIDTLESLRVTGGGIISIDAAVAFDFKGAVSVTKKGKLWPRPIGKTFNYVIGGVPVVQEVFLELDWEATVQAEGGIHVESVFHATKTLSLGFEWHEAVGFQLVADNGFQQNLEFDLSVIAGFEGSVKFVPKISTRFYKTATTSLAVGVGPYFDAEGILLPRPELTRFDAGVNAQMWAVANVKVFNHTLAGWESTKWTMLDLKVFSLPELSWIATPTMIGQG